MVVASEYQRNFWDWVEHGEGNAIINAVAGSGKTYTIIEAAKLIPHNLSALMVAYNNSAAKDLKTRAPEHVDARTVHSLGFACLRRSMKNGKSLQVEGNKMRDICRDRMTESDYDLYGRFATQLVSMAKDQGMGRLLDDHYDSWQRIVNHQGLYLEDYEAEEDRGIELAREMLCASTEQAERSLIIDFDDMLYLPVLWDFTPRRHDWVFLDEAQDTNPVRRELVRRSLGRGARFVAVGDRNQAIYGFTGASIDAMDRIIADFSCQEFDLPVNYRCARSVIAEAQKIVPHISAHTEAPEGEVREINDRELSESLHQLTPYDVVLCRFNAPLVSTAFQLIREGVGCTIAGRDIGEGLVTLFEKTRKRRPYANDMETIYTRLENYHAKERERLLARDQEERLAGLEDRIQCLTTVMEQCDSPDDVTPKIRVIFNNGAGGQVLTLSTIHKSKGGEWPTVLILGRNEMPCKWAKEDWQEEQEYNLIYVGTTRAKEKLILHRGAVLA